MPSVYTKPITERDVTFAEFALRCARGISQLSALHDTDIDAPLPEQLTPNSYYQKHVDECRARVDALEAMTDAEKVAAASKAYADNCAYATKHNSQSFATFVRVNKLLAELGYWDNGDHDFRGLTELMREQLQSVHDWDCFTIDVPQLLPVDEWYALELAAARKRLQSAELSLSEAQERAIVATEWLNKLRARLTKK